MLCPACFRDNGDPPRCLHCGFEEPAERADFYLPLRHRLQQGRYTVGIELGKPGGSGVAYKAWDARRNAVVVIKECLLTESGQVERVRGDPRLRVQEAFRADHRAWLDRFLAEGRLIQQFGHPCIVRVIDVFEENGTACYVMPFVEGTDLVHHLAAHGNRLPQRDVLQMAERLLEALEEIHGRGWVHRDIKPSNVLITRNKRKPVLIDFGAALDDFVKRSSRARMALHTWAYAPPEQLELSVGQGPWTDLYALCATLYRCLAGQPPAPASQRAEASGDTYVPIRVHLPDIEPRLALLIDHGLAMDPGRRPQSAAAARRLLGSEASTADAGTSPAPTPQDPAAPPPSARPPAHSLPPRPPVPYWFGLMPAGAVLALGAVAEEPVTSYLMGLPGLVVVANAVGWGVWRARSGRTAASTAEPQRTSGSTGGSSTGPVSSGPSVLQDVTDTRAGIEIQLHADGAPPRVRTLLPGQTLVVGRTERADLVVRHDLLSGRHVSITVTDDGGFTLEDLNSLNHTYQYRRGADGAAGAWSRIQTSRGRKGRFTLGPVDAGVRLDIRQIGVPR